MNDSLRSRPSRSSGAQSSAGRLVGSTLRTPGGSPASWKRRVIASAVSGVSSAGLRIIVQPAATAGPTLRVTIASGKFHGVTSSAGPTGRFVTSVRRCPSGAVPKRPEIRDASSANQRRNPAA